MESERQQQVGGAFRPRGLQGALGQSVGVERAKAAGGQRRADDVAAQRFQARAVTSVDAAPQSQAQPAQDASSAVKSL